MADVWSVTSWSELRRDGLAADEQAFLHPEQEQRVPYVTQQLQDAPGPVVAVSDYMREVQDQIGPWVPGDFASLGADGFGFSDTRAGGPPLLPHRRPVDRRCGRCRCWPSAARSTRRWPARRPSSYRLLDVTAGTSGNAGGES